MAWCPPWAHGSSACHSAEHLHVHTLRTQSDTRIPTVIGLCVMVSPLHSVLHSICMDTVTLHQTHCACASPVPPPMCS
eukprot:3288835-Amphidinium_carterae.1